MTNAFSSAMPGPLHPRPRRDLASVGWEGRLDECADAHDVVQAVKDYLARWTPEEIAELPEQCRPGKLVDGDDVSVYALNLARAQCSGTSIEIDKLSAFMTSAAARLAQLSAHTPQPPQYGMNDD